MIRRLRSATVKRPVHSAKLLSTAIAEYDLALAAANKSARTRAMYALVLRLFTEFLGRRGVTRPTLAELSNDNVRRFILNLGEPIAGHGGGTRSPVTVRHYYRCLKTFVSHAVSEGWIKANPIRVPAPKAPTKEVEPFSKADVAALLEAAGRGYFAERNRAMVLLGLATGMRAGEIASLTIDRIDFEGMLILVLGKGNKQRIVHMDRMSADALLHYLAFRRTSGGPVFLGRNGQPFTPDTVRAVMVRIGRAAGVSGAHPHRMRHTFALHFLLAHPGAIDQLRVLMGHANLSQTIRYVNLASAHTRLEGASPLEHMVAAAV